MLYETTFIIDGYLHEDRQNVSINRVEKIIKENGGTIIKLDRLGKRRLAYEIKKKQHGYYIYVLFETNDSRAVLELKREFRLNDTILRDLIIKLEGKALKSVNLEVTYTEAGTVAKEAADIKDSVEPAPVTEPAPVAEPAPVIESVPVTESAPTTDAAIETDSTSLSEQDPVTEPAPLEKSSSDGESEPLKSESAEDEKEVG